MESDTLHQNLPQDLVPLPTMPWSVRPDELPLNVDEVRTAIWLESGNVTKAAKRLKSDPLRVRRFIKQSPRLSAELKEAEEQLLDRAQEVVREALDDTDDASRRDTMAKFVLKELGQERGFGKPTNGGKVTINNKDGGLIQVSWGDGSSVAGPEDNSGPVIDHEAAE
jgi:hypothetical protein